MAEVIQSNGKIAVLQQFMFENRDLLDKISGVDIDPRKIGNSKTGDIDDLLGKGTSTALQSMLIAAQLKAGVDPKEISNEFNDTTKEMLRDLLVEKGINVEQVDQFIEDTVHISKGGELAHIYRGEINVNLGATYKEHEADKKTVDADPDQNTEEIRLEIGSDAGKGFPAILAAFFSFLKSDQNDFLANKSVSNMFQSFGFSQNDMNYVRDTGNHLRNDRTNYIAATRSTYARIKNPEETLSSDQAKATIEARAPETKEAIDMLLNERRELVIQTIPLATEATGVSPETMKAVWGVESNYGENLLSATKCKGDWQFTGATWNNIMKKYGDEIAEHLKENHPGYDKIADNIIANNTNRGTLDHLKFDPVVSTYAASYLKMDDARVIGIDPSKTENMVPIYSAYNIGSPDAKKLYQMSQNDDTRSAQAVIGSNARNNPLYFKGNVTAGVALARMGEELTRHHKEYYERFGALESELAQKATVLASNDLMKTGLTETYNHTQETNGKPGTGSPSQPEILTAAFNGNKEGVDQIALAAKEDNEPPQPKPEPESEPIRPDGPTAIASYSTTVGLPQA
ncbi:MAG: hypothetical protein KAJ29_05010 [Alphaproteobacteria bacterium]|nr:hypothetical protein [Alphaproteobacteria bacterium]